MAMGRMAEPVPQDRPPIEADVRACPRCGARHAIDSDIVRDPDALARLRPKLAQLGEVLDDLSEDDYAHWLHALPLAEFLEFIVLEEPCLTRLMGAGRPPLTCTPLR